jgi:hypothetical protein
MAHTHAATDQAVQKSGVLSRVIRPDRGDLSADAARCILRLRFDEHDLERMHELATGNQQGDLSAEELAELAEYRQAGLVLDLLKSRARLSLKRLGLREE